MHQEIYSDGAAVELVTHFCKQPPTQEDMAAFRAGLVDIDGLIRRTFEKSEGGSWASVMKLE